MPKSKNLEDFVVKMRMKHAKRLRYRQVHEAHISCGQCKFCVDVDDIKVCKVIRLQTQEWHSCNAFEVKDDL